MRQNCRATLKRILALTFLASIVSSELLCCISLTKAFPWNTYYSYSEIESELFSLESSGIARVQSIGVSVEGRPIWAIKISDDPDVEDPTEPDILFVGLHHAREWLSAQIPLYIAYRLIEDSTFDWGDSIPLTRARMLIENTEIWIVPVLNPDGLEYTRSDVYEPASPDSRSRFWRKNRRDNGDGTFGVDLARNYDIQWGQDLDPDTLSDGTSDSSHDAYWGPSAFSEPETQAIRDLLLDPSRDFKMVVSYHSFGQLVLYPWGKTLEPAPDSDTFQFLAQEMVDILSYPETPYMPGRTYTPLQTSELYMISGDFCDWVYTNLGIPAFTIELPPELDSVDLSSWWDGFEFPESEMTQVCRDNYYTALFLIDWTVPPTVGSCTSGGAKKDHFIAQWPISEWVYVTGHGYSPLTDYDLYVVEHVDTWIDGMDIPPRIPETRTTILSDYRGGLSYPYSADHILWDAWRLPIVPGDYDIIVDCNSNGRYDLDIDALDTSLKITAPEINLSPPQVDMTETNTLEIANTEDLYVTAEGLPPEIEVHIYVIGWTEWGTQLGEYFQRGNYKWTYASAEATTDTDGRLPPTYVWQAPLTPGDYRIWINLPHTISSFSTGDCWSDWRLRVYDPTPGWSWIYLGEYARFPGEKMYFKGYGWPPEAQITSVTIDEDEVPTFPSPITADDSGYFYGYFNVTDLPSDFYEVHIEDIYGNSAVQSFAVLNQNGDFDEDGLNDKIDTEPTISSNEFSWESPAGINKGVIIEGGNQFLTITEETSLGGIKIIADPTGGQEPAILNIRDSSSNPSRYSQIYVDAGDQIALSDDQLKINVIKGSAKINIFDTDFQRITVDSLEEGNSITFWEKSCYAEESNINDIILVVEERPIMIHPGDTILLNHAPLAWDQSITTNEDTPRLITLRGSDFDGETLSYFIINEPIHGILSGTLPILTYTPELNYYGLDSFTFRANDGTLDSNIASVAIEINPLNDRPVSNAGGPYTTFEGLIITLDAGASYDPEGDPLEYRWDFDGDETWDTDWSSDSQIEKKWDNKWTGHVKVEVSDGLRTTIHEGFLHQYRLTDIDEALVTVRKITPIVPSENQVIQDGVTFRASISDSAGIDWVTFSIKNPDGSTINPIFESMQANYIGSDIWQLQFQTAQLPDGLYSFLIMAHDTSGNVGTETVEFSIRNWAIMELLPASKESKAGRTIPIKFSLRIKKTIDSAQPFIYNEELTIIIYEENDPENILQESTYGDTSKDYRINSIEGLYITNFRTIRKKPTTYIIEIYRKEVLLDSFEFHTQK